MKPLVEYCSGAVESLSAQYKMTGVLLHSSTAGSARERLIQDFLTAHLPEMTSVASGVIIDTEGLRSKQQDIVLVLKSMPRLPFASGHDLIFQEAAVATFEIKTEINPARLMKISQNIMSVKRLTPSTLEGVQFGDLEWPYGRVLSAVLTYSGSDLDLIEGKLNSLPDEGRPDVYLDLTKGILIRNEGLLLPLSGSEGYLRFECPAEGLARLLAILSKVTGRFTARSIKWERYIS